MRNEMTNYGKKTAELIIGNSCDDLVEIKDNGVWPTSECLDYDTSQYFHWNFACDLEGEDDPLEVPHLPIPFTAPQLAVFMLDGVGSFLQDFYGDWQSGPDEKKLAQMGIRAQKARQAVRDAYNAYHEAEKVVGKMNQDIESCTARTSLISQKKLRRVMELQHRLQHAMSIEDGIAKLERAKESEKKWKNRYREAREHFDNEFALWRKAMVRQLLNQYSAEQSESQSATGCNTSIGIVTLASKTQDTTPADVGRVTTKITVHSIKNRAQPLDTEIQEAKRRALNANEPASVWAELVKMAEGTPPEGALIGHSADGIQYQGRKYQATGEPDTLTLKNLRNRMIRAAQRAEPSKTR